MKRLIVKTLGVLLIVIMLSQGGVSFAVTKSEINSQKSKQNEINNQISDAEEKKEEITAEKNKTVEEVNKLNTQISDYENQINELDSKISELKNKIKESEEKLNKAEEDYTNQEKLLEARLVAMQEAGETSYLDFILSSDSITDLISNYYLISEVTSKDTELLEEIQKQKEEIQKAKEQLESSKRELDTSKASKKSVSTQLKTAKIEKDKQVEQLSEDEKEIQAQIDELREYNAQISNEIKAAEQKYAAQLAELKAKQNAASSNSSGSKTRNGTTTSGSNTVSPSAGSGKYIRPVSSGSITSGWYYTSGGFHGAVDYGVPVGTPVYASATGVVIKTANLNYSYGTYVVIQDIYGMQEWYAHGSSLCVLVGQSVQQGQVIMYSGNSGHSTGPHLHFEMRVAPYDYSSCRVNPQNYL